MGSKIINIKEITALQARLVAASTRHKAAVSGREAACGRAASVLFPDLVGSWTLKLYIKACAYVLLTFHYVCSISHTKSYFLKNIIQKKNRTSTT